MTALRQAGVVIGLVTLTRFVAAEESPPPEPPPAEAPAPAQTSALPVTPAPASAPAASTKAPAAAAAAEQTATLPEAPFPFADQWRGDLDASGRRWVSSDVALGMALMEGDPEISGSGRGNGFFVRARVLLHLDLHWALGARFALDRGLVASKNKKAWSDLEVGQLAAGLTLRFAPLVSEAAEVAVLGHAGMSQDSFQATERATGATTTWAGPALVGGGGLEVALYPFSAFRRLALTLLAEVETHSGGTPSSRPAYREGGLPKTSRAVLRSGGGLGFQF
ncbi:MAG: hypothetical protein IT377_15480 [Polyangiaceae bacterium]|nr:hypothetical protein [Polyangiaceae bacterium]